MNDDPRIDHLRRRALRQGVRIVGAAITAAAIGASDSALAKASKSEVTYQDHPHDGKQCRDCKSFIAASGQGEAGCALVDGAISPGGWCTLFAPR
jgi:hypothetical protein